MASPGCLLAAQNRPAPALLIPRLSRPDLPPPERTSLCCAAYVRDMETHVLTRPNAPPCLPVERSAVPPKKNHRIRLSTCPKWVRGHRSRVPWPKGLSAVAIRCCPPALREDAMQEAWLAVSEGRKPDSAVRSLLRREARERACHVDVAAVDPTHVRACI